MWELGFALSCSVVASDTLLIWRNAAPFSRNCTEITCTPRHASAQPGLLQRRGGCSSPANKGWAHTLGREPAFFFPRTGHTHNTGVWQSPAAKSSATKGKEKKRHKRTSGYLSGRLVCSPSPRTSQSKGTLNICQLFLTRPLQPELELHMQEPCIFVEWCNWIFLMQVSRLIIKSKLFISGLYEPCHTTLAFTLWNKMWIL